MAFPAPDTTTFTYDRGSQAILINAATGTVTQTGTAAPATANKYGVVATSAYGEQPANCTVQIDVGGTGSWTTYSVNLLGSLDGINYYSLATYTATSGGIFPGEGIGAARYLSASITTATIASGAPTLTVSMTIGG